MFKIGAGVFFFFFWGGDIFFSHLSFLFSFSLSLEDGPLYCIIVVVLLLYVLGKHLRSYWDGQLT